MKHSKTDSLVQGHKRGKITIPRTFFDDLSYVSRKRPTPEGPGPVACEQLAFLKMIATAAHSGMAHDNCGNEVWLDRGEVCVSLRQYARDHNWTLKFARGHFERLKNTRKIIRLGERAHHKPRKGTPKRLNGHASPGGDKAIYAIVNYEQFSSLVAGSAERKGTPPMHGAILKGHKKKKVLKKERKEKEGSPATPERSALSPGAGRTPPAVEREHYLIERAKQEGRALSTQEMAEYMASLQTARAAAN